MRRLILLRHAKSNWADTGARDQDRVLVPRGREAAAKIGAYMARHALVPDYVLCSSAARTRQTWELVAAAFENAPPISYDDRLYEASPNALLEAVKEARRNAHALLLIGHNPGLQDLATRLIATGNLDARQRLLDKFPTAGLVVIDFPIDDWRKLHAHAGRLDRFVIPRALDSATD